MNRNIKNQLSVNKIFSNDLHFINKEYIVSMSLPWKKISAKLYSELYNMKMHLAKLYYWRDYPEYFRGWKTTCRKGFEKVPKCAHNTKYPEYDKLYELLWEAMEDIFDDTHDTIIKDINYEKQFTEERELPDVTVKDPNFEYFCKDYITELCKKVSEKGGIDSEENSDLIDSLLEKYPLR